MNIKKITLSASMIALHIILSIIPLITLPNGGAITSASMLPILYISFKFGTKTGILSAFCASLIQLMLFFVAPPLASFPYLLAVILLDYIFAFSILGFVDFFYKKCKSIAVSVIFVCFLRFLCHFISGILIWSIFLPANFPIWIGSIIYNSTYMLPETIITTILSALLIKKLIKF